ncbi:MAG: indolepyruvate ferredoxin oxidoreductase family protein [Microvirga sp.]
MADAEQAAATALRDVSLDDKYDLTKDRVFITGTQAIIRMLLMQRERDRRAGLNTAGFVSGYRGSPIGGLDQNLWRAKKWLQANDIVFQPGLNEELAATALWGSQQAELRGDGKYDGVFGVWYGKGPGVDRTGDVFRHANMAGSSRHGGVLALMGDDHTAESSTVAHQSEFAFVDVMTPILNPAGVQELIDYGLYGFALSRFCGTWAALKCVKDNIESTASADGRLDRVKIVIPGDDAFRMPPGGLNIRTPDGFLEQEARLQDFKRDAMLAFVRANNLNHIVLSGGRQPKIGVITVGKSYLDVRQALDELGVDEVKANDMGLRLYKVACPWPLSQAELVEFARGLELIIVVEEKRSLIEVQVREELYGTSNQPVCIGKKDERGNWLFPVKGALDLNDIAIAIGERLLKYHNNDDLHGRVSRLKQAQAMLAATSDVAVRTPHFCSGCPHNTSTVVPEGMRAYAGIGCHFMASWMDRKTDGYTQMGGEGANWIGESNFSTRKHVFQNLGDGTYNHSGSLALRWAIHTKTTVTYKILFNDAVAMTGGQQHEGGLTVDMIARQVRAEGAERIALVTDEPDKYPSSIQWPSGMTIDHRDDLERVQRELAEVPGVSVLIYDQTCAAEKRRRRKRGTMEDPARRVLINPAVCEGCGDCSVQSNCISVEPLETEFGRKRAINQSTCNKDYSCVKGFCPSFVTVDGGKMRKRAPAGVGDIGALPEPASRPNLDKPYNIAVGGVGGTGVLTIGALLGMAAHIEGKASMILDMSGLAQKGGAVLSHVRLSDHPAEVTCSRIVTGTADVVLAADEVVAVAKDTISLCDSSRTRGIINSHVIPTADFVLNRDFNFQTRKLNGLLETALHKDSVFFDFTKPAEQLLGDSIATNMMMMGYAYQKGLLPLSAEAIEQAIEVNGVSIKMNKEAFRLGRLAVADPQRLAGMLKGTDEVVAPKTLDAMTLDELIEHRAKHLTAYQNGRLAKRYRKLVDQVSDAARQGGYDEALTRAVAVNYAKLLAYKDEYEVARLYTDGAFEKQLRDQFEGDFKFNFNLAPPILSRGVDALGRPKKRAFGPWMLPVFRVLAKFKFLRGTPLDIFGRSADRKLERDLIAGYEKDVATVLGLLSPLTIDTAVELLSLPDRIRGYGPVKEKAVADAKARYAQLAADLANPPPAPRQIAAE